MMPYYREKFVNRTVEASTTQNGIVTASGTVALGHAEVTSFRTRPHSDAKTSVIVSDQSADPYAYFIESSSRKRYQARLAERGLKPEGAPDRGHSFELKRHTMVGNLQNSTFTTGSGASTTKFAYANARLIPSIVSGNEMNTVHNGTIVQPASYKETGLDAFAQQAYLRSAPTAAVFDAGTFLGELHEGLPKLPSMFLGKWGSRAWANDYLNIQFAWKPFIADIQNAARALSGATELLASQGKRVHRKYELPPILQADHRTFTGGMSVTEDNRDGFTAGTPAAGGASITSGSPSGMTAESLYRKTRSSKRWFEGEFTSFLPLGFDPSDYWQRLALLLDPRITPATLYELAPWTWLVDWELRISDSIRANELHANDRLVMHYGFAMEHTVYTTEHSWKTTATDTATYNRWSPALPKKGGFFTTTEYKRRLRASPYGFRIGGAPALTSGQLQILGALGLKKL